MVNIISPNMIKTYQTCPKKYYLKYIENLNIPTSTSFFERGKKIHALANYYLQNVDITRIENELTDDEKFLWQRLLNNKYFQMNYYASEFQMSFKADKYWFGGRLDAVVRENKNYYILDYKTGQTPNNAVYYIQTMVYLLALSKHLKNNYDSLKFVYINLKENKNLVIELNNILETEYIKKIIEIYNKIEKDNVYQKNCNGCRNCEYLQICKEE